MCAMQLMVVGVGNELYILDAEQLGFHAGESVQFGEIVEAGKLLSMWVRVWGDVSTGTIKYVWGDEGAGVE